MKKVKSYTSIWSVEKILYAINDMKLPFPVTYVQIAWFVVMFMLMIMFKDVPPLSMIKNDLIVYLIIPVGTAWFMSQKTFDGKKPLSFISTVIFYALRPKCTYGGKAVKKRKVKVNKAITVVRSEYVSDKIY